MRNAFTAICNREQNYTTNLEVKRGFMAITTRTKRKIIVAVSVTISVLLFLLVIAPFTINAIVYDSIFGERYETPEYLRLHIDDFDGLKANRYEFKSNQGLNLVGYRYYVEGVTAKGVVVIAHGLGGGGHNSYLDVAYYFACRGYYVFAYDATGNDESEGTGVNGLPQGVADLSSAIDYLQNIKELKNLPVMLWGHSWGGYSVGAVLNFHPEVKAVASIAGFNQSSDMIRSQGAEYLGGAVSIMMPYVNSIERIKFGQYATASAIDGFANSKCGVFVAHSSDDVTVPIEFGYDRYYDKFAGNERFEFVRYENKGHSNIIYSQSYLEYVSEFNEGFSAYFGGQAPSLEERIAYFSEHLDREKYSDRLDLDLFDKILNFYNSCL